MLGFKHVTAISVPDKSSMSFRFAKLEDKTEEEILLDAEARRADCSRGGRNAQKIRKGLNGLTQKLVSAKSQKAQDRALSNLVEAFEVNSISGKKRGKTLQAGLLGLIARTNKLAISGDVISSLSSALDVEPIIPKRQINSVTKQPGAKKLSDGREEGSGMHSIAAGTRKRQINSATLKPGAKKLSDGREKGSGTKTIAQGRKRSTKERKVGSGRNQGTGGSDKLDEAFRLMQTTKYIAMENQSDAKLLALEEAGFKFKKKPGQSPNDWKDQYGSTQKSRRTCLNQRLRNAKKHRYPLPGRK